MERIYTNGKHPQLRGFTNGEHPRMERIRGFTNGKDLSLTRRHLSQPALNKIGYHQNKSGDVRTVI